MSSDRLGLSRLPIRDAASLLRALAGQALGRLLEGEGEVLLLSLSQSQQRLLERITAGQADDEPAWRRLAWLPFRLWPRRQETTPALSSTLAEALETPMDKERWRNRVFQRLRRDLENPSEKHLPPWAWRIAAKLAWLDPAFIKSAARQISRRLRVERLLTGEMPVPQVHPNAWWLLLALAENKQSPEAFSRLKRMARWQIGPRSRRVEEPKSPGAQGMGKGWVGEWEAWLIRRAQERYPAPFRSLDAPLRRRISSQLGDLP